MTHAESHTAAVAEACRQARSYLLCLSAEGQRIANRALKAAEAWVDGGADTRTARQEIAAASEAAHHYAHTVVGLPHLAAQAAAFAADGARYGCVGYARIDSLGYSAKLAELVGW